MDLNAFIDRKLANATLYADSRAQWAPWCCFPARMEHSAITAIPRRPATGFLARFCPPEFEKK